MNHLRGSIREHLLINSKPLTPWEDIGLLIDNFFSNSYIQQAPKPGSSNMVQQDDINVIRRKGKGKSKGKGKNKPSSASPFAKEKGRASTTTKVKTSAKVKVRTTTTTGATTTTTAATTIEAANGRPHGTTTTTTKEKEEEEEKGKGKIYCGICHTFGTLNITVLQQHQPIFSKHYHHLISSMTSTIQIWICQLLIFLKTNYQSSTGMVSCNQEFHSRQHYLMLLVRQHQRQQGVSTLLAQWSMTSASLSMSTSSTIWTGIHGAIPE